MAATNCSPGMRALPPWSGFASSTWCPKLYAGCWRVRPKCMLPADGAFLIRTMAACLPAPGAGILTQAMYFEATANLTGDMLVKVDRMSMANSLEVRSPLLDHQLAEFAATLPQIG